MSFLCGRIYGRPIFDGGCGKPVSYDEAYRCADCTAAFHRDCLREHFHRSITIGGVGILTLKDALIDCLPFVKCELHDADNPAEKCKKCQANKDARRILAINANYPPVKRQ